MTKSIQSPHQRNTEIDQIKKKGVKSIVPIGSLKDMLRGCRKDASFKNRTVQRESSPLDEATTSSDQDYDDIFSDTYKDISEELRNLPFDGHGEDDNTIREQTAHVEQESNRTQNNLSPRKLMRRLSCPNLFANLQRQKSRQNLMSEEQKGHEEEIEGGNKQQSLQRQNGKTNLFSNKGSNVKTSSPMPRPDRRVLRRQASELVLTTTEKKSLDDLLDEYDSISSCNSPIRSRKKLSISDLNELSISDLNEKSDHASKKIHQPDANNLSSSLTWFDDLMDEYDSIDQLNSSCDQEITWKRCKEPKVKRKSQPVRDLGTRSSSFKRRQHRTTPTRTPMTPRHNSRLSSDPYGLSCPHLGQSISSMLDLDDITERSDELSEHSFSEHDFSDMGSIL